MRKILISILLAGAAVATPAMADPQDGNGRWHHDQQQQERSQAHEERSQAHEERSQAREQVRTEEARPQPRFEMRQQVQDSGRGFNRSRFERGQQQQVEQQQVQSQTFERAYRGNRNAYSGGQQQQVEQSQQSGDWRRNGGSWNRDRSAQQGDRSTWSGRNGSWTGDRGTWTRQSGDYRQREGTQSQYRDSSRWAGGSSSSWNRNWRNDNRYDWRRYRDQHRSIFRLGVYFDPFGYGYRSFDIGYRLQPLYFGQQYWIDPGLYGLPYPPPGTQWVRYWNDALLVDMYTGEVVDEIHDFFW